MDTNTTDSINSNAEQPSKLVDCQYPVCTSELFETLEPLPNHLDIRRDMHRYAVEMARRKPLRRVLQSDYFSLCDEWILPGHAWTDELRSTTGVVRVQISPDVKREDALRGLKEIVNDLESDEEWSSYRFGRFVDEVNTDFGWVVALPEPEPEPKDNGDIQA